jgi:hypothetical protein
VAATPGVGERDHVVDEPRAFEHQERRQRDTPSSVAHGEPATARGDHDVALHRLQLVERAVVRDVEKPRRVPVHRPERAVERRDLLDLAGGGLDLSIGRHHDQVPRDPIAARARRRDQLRLILGVEDHDVGALAAARSHRGDERVLDLLEPDELQGLDPRVVRLLDRREPRVRDDRAPPTGLGPLEQVVVRAPETQERFEIGHALIFPAAAGRTVRVVLGPRAAQGLR